MKLTLALLSLWSSSALALQGNNYLSQLGSGTATSSTPLRPDFAPNPSSSSRPSNGFFPAPSATVGSSNGMADLYSSAPPGAMNSGSSDSSSSSYSSSSTTNTQSQQLLLELWSNQVSVELSASQLYLSASIWFRTQNMPGMAAWMLDESDEERGHGLAILEFAMKRGFPITLKPLDAPTNHWNSPLQVWESILRAEQTNTQNLLKLAAIANECGEYAACAFLDPFHLEQLDAENKVGGIVSTVRGATAQLLVQLDYDLGKQAEEEAKDHEDH
jgi:ferritin